MLDKPVESLPGVGRVSGAALRERGLATVADMLLVLPRHYIDERQMTPLTQLVPGVHQVTVGVVEQSRRVFARRRPLAEVVLSASPADPSGPNSRLRLMWFYAYPKQLDPFVPGSRIRASGRVSEQRGGLTMVHPTTQVLEAEQDMSLQVKAHYPELPGISAKALAKAVSHAVRSSANAFASAVPQAIGEREGLMPLCDAINALHFPSNSLDAATLQHLNAFCSAYHQRLAFEEFFLLELALHAQRGTRVQRQARPLKANQRQMNEAMAALPFELSGAQQRVVAELSADLQRPVPMRRLLQGDVGSGKTAVAMLAAAQAVRAGAQVALMAPTEVLAEQHFSVLQSFGKALGLRIALIRGGINKSSRQQLEHGLGSGEIDIAVGTHALLNSEYSFKRLGLVIVDEQHRFGVNQRLALVHKGDESGTSAHLLVITATPIPRSLALTLYGDLDVSIIDAMPPGRIAPITKVFEMQARDRALGIVRKALDAGGQGFVVCPAIEDSEELAVRSAETTFAELREHLAPYKVALLHGRLAYDERQRVMGEFVAGKVHLLVSTTVIEVGVDVPKANVMLVEHAERFGLAQLHQLRGRIGRAGQVSACLLVHQAQGPDALARLEVLVRTSDGFEIAEEDLVQRGPGELFGRRQSGLAGFRFGNLKRDAALLERARACAREVLAVDPTLKRPEHCDAARALARLQEASQLVVREEAG